jgi:hypothetical protein
MGFSDLSHTNHFFAFVAMIKQTQIAQFHGHQIAGLDLSHNPTMIFGMFAWAGATQIAHGIVTLLVALRYRALVPLFLLVSLIERLLLSWSGWIKHVPVSGHHPPEHYASLISLPVILLFLWHSVRQPHQTQPEIPE